MNYLSYNLRHTNARKPVHYSILAKKVLWEVVDFMQPMQVFVGGRGGDVVGQWQFPDGSLHTL